MRTSVPCSRALDQNSAGLDRPEADRSPCASTIRRAMNRPSPLPPTAVHPHPTSERIEIRWRSDAGTPGPRSAHGPGRCLQPFDETRTGVASGAYATALRTTFAMPAGCCSSRHPDMLRCIEDNDTVIGLVSGSRSYP
jgi:hypothetical protein